jgi:hypothetical protein
MADRRDVAVVGAAVAANDVQLRQERPRRPIAARFSTGEHAMHLARLNLIDWHAIRPAAVRAVRIRRSVSPVAGRPDIVPARRVTQARVTPFLREPRSQQTRLDGACLNDREERSRAD